MVLWEILVLYLVYWGVSVFFFFFLNRANTSDAVNYGCFNVCIV